MRTRTSLVDSLARSYNRTPCHPYHCHPALSVHINLAQQPSHYRHHWACAQPQLGPLALRPAACPRDTPTVRPELPRAACSYQRSSTSRSLRATPLRPVARTAQVGSGTAGRGRRDAPGEGAAGVAVSVEEITPLTAFSYIKLWPRDEFRPNFVLSRNGRDLSPRARRAFLDTGSSSARPRPRWRACRRPWT